MVETHNHTQSSNSLIDVLLPVVKDLYLISIITSVGLLYAVGFLVHENRGKLIAQSRRIKTLAQLAIVVWLVCTIGGVFVELANLLGGGFLDSFNTSALSSFLFSTSIGRDYVFQIVR